MNIYKDLLEKRVKEGAKFLDVNNKGWYNKISIQELALEDCLNCVLGQLCGEYGTGLWDLNITEEDAEKFGFILPVGYRHIGQYWDTLTELWKEQIEERKNGNR